jgi:hypothetical protein
MQLLSEIDSICNKNRIKYITGGIVARAVYEKKKLVFPCLDIYVKRRHVQKLIKCLGVIPQNRALEIKENGDAISLYYTDKTTTLINSYDMSSYKNKGMHIHILAAESEGIDKKLLRTGMYYDWNGYKVRLPKDLKAWNRQLFYRDGKYEYPGYPNASCIVSSTVGYESIENNVQEWKELCESMTAAKKHVDDTTARIDNRSKVIDAVMDKVRNLYEEE